MIATLIPHSTRRTATVPKPSQWRELGQAIHDARVLARLTQEQLADRLDLSTGYIGHLEQGQRRPSPEMIRAIARVLTLDQNHLSALAGYTTLVPDELDTVRTERRKADVFRLMERYSADQLERLLNAATLFFHPGLGDEPPAPPPAADGGAGGAGHDPDDA